MKRTLQAVATGILLVLSLPPIGIWPMAWVAFVPLMYSLSGAGMKRGFALGWLSGAVFFLGTVYWVVNSMHNYGGLPIYVSIFVMLLLVAFLSVYPAFFGLILGSVRYGRHGLGLAGIVAVPALWVALEYLRGYIFTGFPWVLIGYSQVGNTTLIQFADLTGVWGVSFIILAVNTCIFLLLKARVDTGIKRPVNAVLAVLLMLTMVLAYGFIRVPQVDTEVLEWPGLKVAVVQGGIDQQVKWDKGFQDKTLDIYGDLSVKAAKEGSELIIWPETAVPFYLGEHNPKEELVARIVRRAGVHLLTGAPSYDYDRQTRNVSYFNSAYFFAPDGRTIGRYDKAHLVPYGEYVPLRRFFPFIKKLTAGVGDFSSGPGAVPIAFKEEGLGVIICYEAIFPKISAAAVKNGATLLVNLTNDAWFGRSSAPYQHFSMSVFRAVENRVFLVRAANTGISAVVDPVGRVLSASPLFVEELLVETVGLKRGEVTFYTKYGDIFAYGCLAVSGFFILLPVIRREGDINV
jgi:apolipoprotein N-acyltransferase